MTLRDSSTLTIGDLIPEIPIIQGGMGVGISLSGLASAVSKAGGIGVIATAGIGVIEPDYEDNFKEANKRALKKEIRKAKSKTDGILGINLMVALTDFKDLLSIAVEEEIDIVFLSAGLPSNVPKTLSLNEDRSISTKFVPVVSSARVAKIIIRYWSRYNYLPDAIVVEGPRAGGHLGFKVDQIDDPNYSLEKIVPEVISVVESVKKDKGREIPIIAAGGIFDGADIFKFQNLGASGFKMATRFVGTYECDADRKFKEQYLSCEEGDLMKINSPVGLPGRAIKNKFLQDVERGVRKPFECPWKCLQTCNYKEVPYCIAKALFNARKGDLENGFAFAGSNAYRVNEIVSVKELIGSLEAEYERAMLVGTQ
ncbi:MAG: nitronate monooxygenase [Bacteroidales bacterium]|nr:nitronate monooxygenase [Bacteroidales bacterium]